MKLYITGDTGGSGHGSTGLGTVKYLLKHNPKGIEFNFSTHEWAWNEEGFRLGNPGRQFPDFRFKEWMMREGHVNQDYLLKKKRVFRLRPHNLEELPFSMDEVKLENFKTPLMVRQFEGREDVNLAIGSIDFAERQPDYAYNITEVTNNTTKCPRYWREAQYDTDEIWVPCQWAYDSLVRTGLDEDKIQIIPYGIDFSHEPTFCDRITKLEDDTFTFGTVARWVNLKGLDVLLEAYLEEFIPDEDDVRLFIKTTTNNQRPLTPQMVGQTIQQITSELRIPDPPEIGFQIQSLPTQSFWDLLGAFDCFVFPTRAEAVGISPIQAMGIGVPTICTDYSACTEYINDKTAFPLDYEEVPVQQHSDKFYFYRHRYNGKWANPDKDHLKELMREVYEMSRDNSDKLKKIAQRGKELVREKYDWNKHIKTRIERIKEVSG